MPIISGFHSPVEKEVLTNLLRGDQPIVICPARSIHNMRIPKEWNLALESGQLLILSPFNVSQGRVTAKTAIQRNHFVAVLVQKVFVAYAEPGGKTEQFCKQVLAWGTPILTFDTKDNLNLLDLGAIPIENSKILD
jgi:hypothetical protein